MVYNMQLFTTNNCEIMEKLKKLQAVLPEALIADMPWLAAQGYSGSLVGRYVRSGWLQRLAHGVYMRPGSRLQWEGLVVSLQSIIGRTLVVGGLSALELQGYAHFLHPDMPRRIYLHGNRRPPGWLGRLGLAKEFHFRGSARIFGPAGYCARPQRCVWDAQQGRFEPQAPVPTGAVVQVWGDKNFAMQVSGPERALLELLDELPGRQSFADVDLVVEGLFDMQPARLQQVLADCTSVKVKRLALWFIERHHRHLLEQLDCSAISQGSGNRVLAAGGYLDRKYRITLPAQMKHASSH